MEASDQVPDPDPDHNQVPDPRPRYSLLDYARAIHIHDVCNQLWKEWASSSQR